MPASSTPHVLRRHWLAEAAKLALRDPAEGLDRAAVRLGLDRQEWSRALPVDADWEEHLHEALDAPWPCPNMPAFEATWHTIEHELSAAGLRMGRGVYGGWDDADAGLARALSCLLAHRPVEIAVETGVARGLTSRLILESLAARGAGHLWSIDLQPIDSSLHTETGAAVPERLRGRWTYVAGTSRRRLRSVLAQAAPVDLFVHDSLHTERNLRFELTHAWKALRPGGAVLADDVQRNDAFGEFVAATPDAAPIVVEHADGVGCYGILLKRPG